MNSLGDDPTESAEMTQQEGLTLADKLVTMMIGDEGNCPRVVPRIIGLLRAGDIKSARLTYNWEADKLAFDRKYKPVLEQELMRK